MTGDTPPPPGPAPGQSWLDYEVAEFDKRHPLEVKIEQVNNWMWRLTLTEHTLDLKTWIVVGSLERARLVAAYKLDNVRRARARTKARHVERMR